MSDSTDAPSSIAGTCFGDVHDRYTVNMGATMQQCKFAPSLRRADRPWMRRRRSGTDKIKLIREKQRKSFLLKVTKSTPLFEKRFMLKQNVLNIIKHPQRSLQATGSFASVSTLDASMSLPTLYFLQQYDVVLVWSSGGAADQFMQDYSSIADYTNIGDVLAQYWNTGGSVVLAVDALYDNKIEGSFGAASSGYTLIDESAGGAMASQDTLGTLKEPQSPLLVGVSSLGAQSNWHSTGAVINGGVVVASWMSGAPLVVRGTKAGRPLVALNMYPVSAATASIGWTGDGAALIRNALLYSACSSCGYTYLSLGACLFGTYRGIHIIFDISLHSALVHYIYSSHGDKKQNFIHFERS